MRINSVLKVNMKARKRKLEERIWWGSGGGVRKLVETAWDIASAELHVSK